MEIMTQERYQEYRKELKEQGYNHIETKLLLPDTERAKQIFGEFVPELLQPPKSDDMIKIFTGIK